MIVLADLDATLSLIPLSEPRGSPRGRIAVGFMTNNQGLSIAEYVRQQVSDLIGEASKPLPQPQDVVLYGFGRIGRLMARLLIEKAGGGDVLR